MELISPKEEPNTINLPSGHSIKQPSKYLFYTRGLMQLSAEKLLFAVDSS